MSMFARHSVTYGHESAVVGYILKDNANPLKRICELIPENSKVLDIGAGNGLLAVVMRAINKDVIMDGVEPDPHAANIAKPQYRYFWTGYVQDFRDTIQQEHYDYVVMADVLEHFQDPQSFLQELVSWIPSRTRIVLSIPNIAFGAIRLDLLKGNFRYVDSGILERTHLRFFTLETLMQLVLACGLSVERLCFLQRNFLTTDIRHNILSVGWKTLYKLMKDETASVYQFVVVLSQSAVRVERNYYGTRTRICASDVIKSILRRWFKKA
jgi:2-polyprenyl-3-methyl-5-hydroxy-6-metoxy-1,4-benzoquinol methylase